ncbi:MAG: PAS domain-containing sensor histidine kinase [Deltaproteobacteria bacterium]|nr:MAG: PAS domain-containing sensor histidine kinase [Deltaproteobacteria bacterium]
MGDAQRLAEGLPVGIAFCSQGRIRWANAAFLRLFGCGELSKLCGTSWSALFEDSGAGLPDPTAVGVECDLRRPDRAPRRVLVRQIGAGRDASEEAWTIVDVTHERQLEVEVHRAGRALHRANRNAEALAERLRREAEEREELLTVVSHELRTPVTVIAGYNKLLLSETVGPLNEEQRRFLNESTKSCQRLSGFIGNLLEASRERAGDSALEVSLCPLAPTIEGVVQSLAPLLEERGLKIELHFGAGASRARFDPLRIEQVLTNLVGNAIKHARPGGRIEISTRRVGPSACGFVEVAVSDDGPGIAEEDRERIFQPYVQAGEDGPAGGLGLGLAICRRIVEAHGGSIRVAESDVGGARFVFTLPAAGGAEVA